MFAAHIGYLHAGVGLFQNRHNLRLCESGLSHRFLLRLQCQNSLQVTCRQRGEAYGVSVYPLIDDQDIVATKPTFKTIPTPLVIMNMVAAVARLGLRQVRPSVWLTTARRLPYWGISVVSGSRVLSTMVPRPLTAASKGPSPSGNYLIAAFHLRKACLGSGLRFIRRRGR